MPDKKKLIKEFILKNPNLNATETLKEIQKKGLGIRKTNFLALYRETKKLPEPTKVKREQSIPIKHRVAKPKVPKSKVAKAKPSITKIPKKKPVIPFEKTKFGKMVKTAQTVFNVNEKKAIIYTRKILKISRTDYDKLEQIDQDILIQYGY